MERRRFRVVHQRCIPVLQKRTAYVGDRAWRRQYGCLDSKRMQFGDHPNMILTERPNAVMRHRHVTVCVPSMYETGYRTQSAYQEELETFGVQGADRLA